MITLQTYGYVSPFHLAVRDLGEAEGEGLLILITCICKERGVGPNLLPGCIS